MFKNLHTSNLLCIKKNHVCICVIFNLKLNYLTEWENKLNIEKCENVKKDRYCLNNLKWDFCCTVLVLFC